MICDYCTHVRYSADGGSTYCGRSGKYKGICRFNPNLEKCPQCGSKVRLARIWEDSYIIAPKDYDGCIYCRNFTDKPSTKEKVTEQWNDAVCRIKRGWKGVTE